MTLEPSPQDRRTAAAMSLALLRWHLYDFGAPDAPVMIVDPADDGWGAFEPVRYSPCWRWVHFRRADGSTGCMRRRAFFKAVWSGPVRFLNFHEVTR